MADRLLPLKSVTDRTSLSKVQIYRMMAWGKFPRPVPVGPHRVAWVEREVDAWIAERVALPRRGSGDGYGKPVEVA